MCYVNDSVHAWFLCLQTLVLEGAKVELNDTDGSKVGNGYTRYDIVYQLVYYVYGFCGLTWVQLCTFQICMSQIIASSAKITQVLPQKFHFVGEHVCS